MIMSNSFCKKIDKELLVEKYVAGKLSGVLLNKFEKHISVCDKHNKALVMERMIKEGITVYARDEMKTRLRKRIQKKTEYRYVILKFAAILFIVVISPLILYYHFHIDHSVNISDKELNRRMMNEAAPVDSIKMEKLSSHRFQDQSAVRGMEDLSANEIKKSEAKSSVKMPLQVPAQSIDAPLAEPLKEQSAKGKLKVRAPEINGDKLAENIPVSAKEKTRETLSIPASQQYLNKTLSTGGGEQSQLSESGERDKKGIETEIVTINKDQAAVKMGEVSSDYVSAGERSEQNESILRRQIARHDPEINDCFYQYKEFITADSLEVNVELTILLDGRVERVEIINSTMNIDKLNDCMVKAILSWKFSQQESKVYLRKKYLYRKEEGIKDK
jgi:outer membrane biosynthesis protein TonB